MAKKTIVAITTEELKAQNFIFSKKTDLDKSYNVKASALERAKLCFIEFGKISTDFCELRHSIVEGCYTFLLEGEEMSRVTDLDYAIENFVDWSCED